MSNYPGNSTTENGNLGNRNHMGSEPRDWVQTPGLLLFTFMTCKSWQSQRLIQIASSRKQSSKSALQGGLNHQTRLGGQGIQHIAFLNCLQNYRLLQQGFVHLSPLVAPISFSHLRNATIQGYKMSRTQGRDSKIEGKKIQVGIAKKKRNEGKTKTKNLST